MQHNELPQIYYLKQHFIISLIHCVRSLACLAMSCAQGFTRQKPSVIQLCSHLDAQLEKYMLTLYSKLFTISEIKSAMVTLLMIFQLPVEYVCNSLRL